MNPETKQCQNCKQDFVIQSEDFDFYKKVGVPAPTFCPECRFQRRLTWRNEWQIFKKADVHGNEIFSGFHRDSPVKIMKVEEWFSDSWDSLATGRDYDFTKPFFVQMQELLKVAPIIARSLTKPVNSEYCTNASGPKNCYLSFGISYSENCTYVIWSARAKDCMDCHMIFDSELCYGCVNMVKCYSSLFSFDCESCDNVILSKNLVGCSNCFGCVGLKNKSYYIFNQPYSKEEYVKKLQEFNMGSRENFEKLYQEAAALWLTFPHKYIHGVHNVNAVGEYIKDSKNALYCYRVIGAEDVKYCQNFTLGPAKDSYDHSNFGDGSELVYETLVAGNQASNIKFCSQCYASVSNLQYSIYCLGASNLFGCVGVRAKQYCILNKQYTKEEYEELVPKIIQHMNDMPYVDAKGRVYKYGEFFPSELSPYAYNETSAYQEFWPLTKQEALEKGFTWREPEKRDYATTIASADLPDSIADAQDSITKEVIGCQHEGTCNHQCATAFKILALELEFYKKHNIPLPLLCPNCRHAERLTHRNPPKLWQRHCSCIGEASDDGIYKNQTKHFHDVEECPNEFETSYAPDRPEIVYCEGCYNSEVA
ncbi:MAG TPA: hypothetical protein VJC06_01260 [Candidatus Paceibacterota bacterium]